MERRLLGRNQVQSVSSPFSIFCEMLPSFSELIPIFLCIQTASALMKGREDDNIETIRKRFRVYLESTLPVINYYASKGKVRKVIVYFLYIFFRDGSCNCPFLYVFPFKLTGNALFVRFKIDAAKPVEAVFEDVKAVFSSMKDQVDYGNFPCYI